MVDSLLLVDVDEHTRRDSCVKAATEKLNNCLSAMLRTIMK